MNTDNDPLITRKQAAAILGGVHRSTIIRWEEAGRLPAPTRISKRVVGYRRSVIEKLLVEGGGA